MDAFLLEKRHERDNDDDDDDDDDDDGDDGDDDEMTINRLEFYLREE